MAVETKKVTGRRTIRFNSYDDIIADARMLAGQETQALGNWSLAQILEHLTKLQIASIDGGLPKGPLLFRLIVPFFKKTFLNDGLPSGATPPANLKPLVSPGDDVNLEVTLENFCHSCERCRDEPKRARHPFMGNLSREDWDKFNFRHAELHLSFIQPI